MIFRHLFVIDPLATLNLQLDSSLRMMAALAARGAQKSGGASHEIYACEPRHLSWAKGAPAAHALCQRLQFPIQDEPTRYTSQPASVRGLQDFAAIHMRKDPPYDLDYVTTTWLLDTAPATTRVYNAPAALRSYNEKLAIFRLQDAAKAGLVSSDPEELLAFAQNEAMGDAILKPLTLFGGRGIVRLQVGVDAASQAQARALLNEETGNGKHLRLMQAFDTAIFAGEVRVFTAFGKSIAWCLKRPAQGQYLANTRAGARLEAYQPNNEERQRVERVAADLLKDGVVFIGFDVIGGYISEVNITSPRLLVGEGDAQPHYNAIAELVESDLEVYSKTLGLRRKTP